MNLQQFIQLGIKSVFRGFKKPAKKPALSLAKSEKVSVEKKRVMKMLSRYVVGRVEQGMDVLRNAVDLAKEPLRHDRSLLYANYESFVEDSHLLGVRRVFQNKVLKEGFTIRDEKGEEHPKLKKLINKQWMHDFWGHVLETTLWGHTLLQPDTVDGKVVGFDLIPRTHVSPEFGRIYLNSWFDGAYIDYREDLKGMLLELGRNDDLGILAILGREIVRKNYADSDWGRHSERFGMPTILLMTKEARDTELDKKEEALQNLGASGYMVLDGETDDVKHLESHINTPYMMYQTRIELAHALINLIMIGSTTLGGEQAFVGTAEVGERTADDFVLAALRSISFSVNDVLLPWLIANGYSELEGKEFEFNSLREEDNEPAPKPETPTQPGEKKKLSKEDVLPDSLDLCCGGKELLTLALEPGVMTEIERIIEEIAKLIWGGKLPGNVWGLDSFRSLVKAVADTLWGAFGKEFTPVAKWDIKAYSLAKKIQENVFHFSGAKSLSLLEDMKNGLFDGSGKLKSWKAYREEVLALNSQYNISYLETERNSALLGGTMAGKWEQLIERNKDLYPYLRYETEGDARVRVEHERMNGITLRVDSPFWSNFYPPNGWNCRCDVTQLSEDDYEEYKAEREALGNDGMVVFDEEKAIKTGETQIKDRYFHRNTGKNGILYPETSKYFKQFSSKDKAKLDIVARDNRVSDYNVMRNGFKKKTEKGVWVHEDETLENNRKPSYQDNMIPLGRLAEAGWECKKIPEVSNGRLFHNCDAMLAYEGKLYLAEVKRIREAGARGIENTLCDLKWFHSSRKRGVNADSVVIDIRDNPTDYSEVDLKKAVKNRLRGKRNIKTVIFIDKERITV